MTTPRIGSHLACMVGGMTLGGTTKSITVTLIRRVPDTDHMGAKIKITTTAIQIQVLSSQIMMMMLKKVGSVDLIVMYLWTIPMRVTLTNHVVDLPLITRHSIIIPETVTSLAVLVWTI
jgi:hypothetical protein